MGCDIVLGMEINLGCIDGGFFLLLVIVVVVVFLLLLVIVVVVDCFQAFPTPS